jgi:dTDP-4-amino-4,6-dideoxygalactose transaminase
MLFIKKDIKTSEQLYENAKMIRSHGLIRVLDKNNYTRQTVERNNPDIDCEFLFEKIGTNYRLTDLNAFFGLLDTKRYFKYIKHRRKIWECFTEKLNNHYKLLPLNKEIIPFCLPIIYKKDENIKGIKQALNKKGWETRPVICFLPINPAFQKYSNNKQYPNSQFLHEHGFYVGLNKDIKLKDIDVLFDSL